MAINNIGNFFLKIINRRPQLANENPEKENTKYKDSVFTDLFQNHPENFLSLYNAIHNTDLKMDEVTIVPERIEQSLYHTTHNDVSMMINNRWIVLIEHQSTINENMPIRLLDYVSKIYDKVIPTNKRYGKYPVYIPEPEFYVFYNGTDPYPDEKVLKLSDLYITHSHKPDLELEVTVFNIYKPSSETSLNILNKCDILKQYCDCIDIIRKVYRKDHPETFDLAIQECLKKNILGTYLEQAAKGRHNLLIAEYDYETDIRVQREESFEAGANKKAVEAAIACLKEGDSVEKVSRCINLPLEQVQKLAEEINGDSLTCSK